MHVRQVKQDILYAFEKPGFGFIEVLSPCPIGFGKSNQFENGLDEMLLYRDRCILADGVPLDEMGIELHDHRPIYVGRLVDRDLVPYRPVRLEATS